MRKKSENISLSTPRPNFLTRPLHTHPSGHWTRMAIADLSPGAGSAEEEGFIRWMKEGKEKEKKKEGKEKGKSKKEKKKRKRKKEKKKEQKVDNTSVSPRHPQDLPNNAVAVKASARVMDSLPDSTTSPFFATLPVAATILVDDGTPCAAATRVLGEDEDEGLQWRRDEAASVSEVRRRGVAPV